MIVCQKCQKNPATVHVTEIVNKKKHEIHLCEQCAREQNVTGVPVKATMNVTELLSNLVGKAQQGEGEGPAEPMAETACPTCGITYAEFRNTGRLGCPQDYEIFADMLNPLIEKIHGGEEHVGKAPQSQGEGISRAAEVRRCKAQLKEAVATEDYETAARLRDRIAELEGTDAQ